MEYENVENGLQLFMYKFLNMYLFVQAIPNAYCTMGVHCLHYIELLLFLVKSCCLNKYFVLNFLLTLL